MTDKNIECYSLSMQDLLLFLSQHQGVEFYVFLTLVFIFSGCYFPISSDLTIITVTGLSAATGLYDVSVIFFCVLTGILTGDTINFLIAKNYGPSLLKRRRMQKIIKPEKVEKMILILKKSGAGFIFFVRFMPFVRTVLFFSAGLMQVSTWKFILYNGLSTQIYLTTLMFLSYKIGTDLSKLSSSVLQFQLSFAVFVIAVFSILFHLKKHQLK